MERNLSRSKATLTHRYSARSKHFKSLLILIASRKFELAPKIQPTKNERLNEELEHARDGELLIDFRQYFHTVAWTSRGRKEKKKKIRTRWEACTNLFDKHTRRVDVSSNMNVKDVEGRLNLLLDKFACETDGQQFFLSVSSLPDVMHNIAG